MSNPSETGHALPPSQRGRWRRPALWVLGLLMVGIGGWWLARFWQAHQALLRAQEALARWDFDEARTHLAVVRALRPGDRETLFLAARTARRAGVLDEAASLLEAYQKQVGITPSGAMEWAMLRAQSGDVRAVERELSERALADDPEAPLILEALAKGYLHIYELPNAYGCYDALVQRQPENAAALLARGQTADGMSNFERGKADYEQAVQVAPHYAPARLRLAQTLIDHFQGFSQAAEHLEALRRQRPNDNEILVTLAQCRRELGDLEEARRILEESLAKSPGNPLAEKERGRLELAAGQWAAAEAHLSRAVDSKGSDREGLFLLAQALERQGKTEAVAKIRQRLDEVESDLKGLEKAMKEVAARPADPEPRTEAGRLCVRNGQPEEGLRWFQGALQLNPNHQPTHHALAELYAEKGRSDLAEKHRRLAERMRPNP